jgi:hypothetical protein
LRPVPSGMTISYRIGGTVMRIQCCIAHCRRSRKHVRVPVVVEGIELDFGEEWICQKHWSAIPTVLRREHSTAKRRVKRLRDFPSEIESAGIWKRCKATATEIAFGLG